MYDIEKAFRAVEDELMKSMIRNMKRHCLDEVNEEKEWEMWQTLQLQSLEEYKRDNQKKFQSTFSRIDKEIAGLISEARSQGNMEQEIKILEAIKKGFKPKGSKSTRKTMGEFFKLNDRKLNALINATKNDFHKAERAVLRMAEDQYRQAIFNAQVYANTGAGTYAKAVDMATKDFLNRGINCIEYANGARHTISDYAAMAIQTASKRAYLTGEGEKRKEWGITTVIMNKRGNACPKCLPFVGKVLIDDVWSGGKQSDGPYMLMSFAMAQGLYHPRCKDTHTTYFEGISTPGASYTKNELTLIENNYRREQKQQYAKRQEERFRRLAEYSLDEENHQQYEIQQHQWERQRNGERKLRPIKQQAQTNIQNASTLEELNGAATETLGFEVEFTNSTVEYAREQIECYEKLASEYNQTAKVLKLDTSSMLGKSAGAETFFAPDHNYATITVSGKNAKQTYLDKLHAYGVVVDGGNENIADLTHEFAHTIASSKNGNEDFWKEIKSIKNRYNRALTKIDKENIVEKTISYEEAIRRKTEIFISQYANKTVDEFMAEAFTDAKLSANPSPYSKQVLEVVDKYFKKKPLVNSDSSDIIEMYRKGSTHRKVSASGKHIIDEATYHKIVNPAIKAGADIRIAEGEYLEHIREHGTALTVGDVVFFTPERTVSDVLEEVHHFYQNKRGLNYQYDHKQREILNEIDAKEYLLSVSDKYHIPEEEIEETKQHLESYKKQMQEMKERGEWID